MFEYDFPFPKVGYVSFMPHILWVWPPSQDASDYQNFTIFTRVFL